jgi:hypothetical protein
MSWAHGLGPSVISGLGTALGAGLVAFGWLVVRRLGQMVRLLRQLAGVVPKVDDHERRLSILEGAIALLVRPKEKT